MAHVKRCLTKRHMFSSLITGSKICSFMLHQQGTEGFLVLTRTLDVAIHCWLFLGWYLGISSFDFKDLLVTSEWPRETSALFGSLPAMVWDSPSHGVQTAQAPTSNGSHNKQDLPTNGFWAAHREILCTHVKMLYINLNIQQIYLGPVWYLHNMSVWSCMLMHVSICM